MGKIGPDHRQVRETPGQVTAQFGLPISKLAGTGDSMLLELFKSGKYFATGAYFPGATLQMGLPVEWHLNVVRANWRLLIEGTYRHHSGTTNHPFRLEVDLDKDQLGRGHFHLNSFHTGEIVGTTAGLGRECSFLGRRAGNDGFVSMHLVQVADLVFEVSGQVAVDAGTSIAYQLKVIPNDPLLAKANVVSLAKGGA